MSEHMKASNQNIRFGSADEIQPPDNYEDQFDNEDLSFNFD
jgi:hypothetical protein